MKNQFEITAETRGLQGKSASRRLRRTGKVPAILYGAGKEPACLQLDHNDMLLRTEHEAFYSRILTIKMADGGEEKVVVKAMQRHPYRRFILHMDFLRINELEELSLRVPIHFINEEKCIGVKQGGGVISHSMSDLEVVCLPKDLPEYIEVDLADVPLGHSIHLGDLKMPEGVRIATLVHGGDASLAVASVQAPRVLETPEEVSPEAATPAAPAAPAA